MTMFGLPMTVIGVIALAAVAAGAICYVLLFDRIAAERKASRRLSTIKTLETDQKLKRSRHDKQNDQTRRRRSIQEQLEQAEKANRERGYSNKKKPPLKLLLKQAGMKASPTTFYLISATLGAVIAITLYILPVPIPPIVLPGIFVVIAFGMPRWWVNMMRKKRIQKFLDKLPDALEIISRGVRSGLPLPDCMRIVASEAQDPVRSEFQAILERQQVGMSLPESVLKMPETMPCPEANFFGIVIQIQSQAGGNLAEAIGNLATVLRDRKKMKAKVNALSMEAKASAYIIGTLPILVGLLVFLMSPGYIMPLFVTDTGHMALAVGVVMMGLGTFVMKKMINFEV